MESLARPAMALPVVMGQACEAMKGGLREACGHGQDYPGHPGLGWHRRGSLDGVGCVCHFYRAQMGGQRESEREREREREGEGEREREREREKKRTGTDEDENEHT